MILFSHTESKISCQIVATLGRWEDQADSVCDMSPALYQYIEEEIDKKRSSIESPTYR